MAKDVSAQLNVHVVGQLFQADGQAAKPGVLGQHFFERRAIQCGISQGIRYQFITFGHSRHALLGILFVASRRLAGHTQPASPAGTSRADRLCSARRSLPLVGRSDGHCRSRWSDLPTSRRAARGGGFFIAGSLHRGIVEFGDTVQRITAEGIRLGASTWRAVSRAFDAASLICLRKHLRSKTPRVCRVPRNNAAWSPTSDSVPCCSPIARAPICGCQSVALARPATRPAPRAFDEVATQWQSLDCSCLTGAEQTSSRLRCSRPSPPVPRQPLVGICVVARHPFVGIGCYLASTCIAQAHSVSIVVLVNHCDSSTGRATIVSCSCRDGRLQLAIWDKRRTIPRTQVMNHRRIDNEAEVRIDADSLQRSGT